MAFPRANASASAEISKASICAAGQATAMEIARHPLPVPISSTLEAASLLSISMAASAKSSVSGRGTNARPSTCRHKPRKSTSPKRCCRGTRWPRCSTSLCNCSCSLNVKIRSVSSCSSDRDKPSRCTSSHSVSTRADSMPAACKLGSCRMIASRTVTYEICRIPVRFET